MLQALVQQQTAMLQGCRQRACGFSDFWSSGCSVFQRGQPDLDDDGSDAAEDRVDDHSVRADSGRR